MPRPFLLLLVALSLHSLAAPPAQADAGVPDLCLTLAGTGDIHQVRSLQLCAAGGPFHFRDHGHRLIRPGRGQPQEPGKSPARALPPAQR